MDERRNQFVGWSAICLYACLWLDLVTRKNVHFDLLCLFLCSTNKIYVAKQQHEQRRFALSSDVVAATVVVVVNEILENKKKKKK